MLYYLSARESGDFLKKNFKKIQKNLKKVLDKANKLCYSKQAAADEVSRREYLEN